MVVKQRNFGLDILRALSILLVLLSHRYVFDYEFGLVGVQMFFVLSGFLIGQILLKEVSKEISIKSMMTFWKRRWFRTLPMYYLILLLKILVYGNPYGWKIIVYFLFLQANFVGISFFSVSWSLVVEEWFYIILPIVLLVILKFTSKIRKQLYFLFTVSLFFLLIRFIWNSFGKGVIIYQFDCLLLGVGLAFIKIHFNDFYKKLNTFYIFFISISGVSALTYILGDVSDLPLISPFYRVIWYFMISICISFMIPFIENNSFINMKVRKVNFLYYFFTVTSILTYSIYLLHMEVFRLLVFKLNDSILVIIQIVVLYFMCTIIYILYEHPMLSLRDNMSLKHYFSSIKKFSLKNFDKH